MNDFSDVPQAVAIKRTKVPRTNLLKTNFHRPPNTTVWAPRFFTSTIPCTTTCKCWHFFFHFSNVLTYDKSTEICSFAEKTAKYVRPFGTPVNHRRPSIRDVSAWRDQTHHLLPRRSNDIQQVCSQPLHNLSRKLTRSRNKINTIRRFCVWRFSGNNAACDSLPQLIYNSKGRPGSTLLCKNNNESVYENGNGDFFNLSL